MSFILPKIVIIGLGYVGNSIATLCEKNKLPFYVHDITHKIGNFTFLYNPAVVDSENTFYFVCVPTPMKQFNGPCDTSIVESVLQKLIGCKGQIIIKSTIVPGTTEALSKKYNIKNVSFCPEFLREATFKEDTLNANFVMFSYNTEIQKQLLEKLFKEHLYLHNPDIKIVPTNSKTAELYKYSLNSFLAVKVWYFNKIYQLCEQLDINYSDLQEFYKLDSRIGEYGTRVPGINSKFGFGGTCLPKDTTGMCFLLEDNNLFAGVLRKILQENTQIRLSKKY